MDQFREQSFVISSLGVLLCLLGLWLGYHTLLMAYNVSPFHQLSKFPGPKVAAASYLCEVYYDWWLVGRYTKAIQRMHEQYGKILIYYTLVWSALNISLEDENYRPDRQNKLR
jgi:hypothetical protein